MLLLFFFLGAAAHGKVSIFSFDYVFAAIALAASFVAATTLNDIADKEIDKINHPRHRGRPLVTGEATERDLIILHVVAAIISVLAGFLINVQAGVVMISALAINYAYSAPPLKLSYKPYFAPLSLTLAYVGITYWLGVATVGDRLGWGDVPFLTALGILFLGRIILKDFRDRVGDAQYGKRTLLLQYGKPVVCTISMAAVIIGDILLLLAMRLTSISFVLMVQAFIVAILVALGRLRHTQESEQEQIAIGIGAKMGNGLLLLILSILLLRQVNASHAVQLAFGIMLTAAFLANFLYLTSSRVTPIIGYRG